MQIVWCRIFIFIEIDSYLFWFIGYQDSKHENQAYSIIENISYNAQTKVLYCQDEVSL